MTLRVDIWSDIACPWCYIGQARFNKALERFAHRDQVEVNWHAFLLNPDLPERYEGTEIDYLVEIKGMPRDQVQQMLSHVESQATGEGLEMNFSAVVPASSIKAHHLIQAVARTTGADVEAVEQALFTAHFVNGEVISDEDVLVRIGTEVGLTEQQARAALTDAGVAEVVQKDLADARAYGIGGVPFFVFENKYAVSGAQPAEVFEGALTKVWEEMQPAQPRFITVGGPEGEACGPQGC